MNTTSIHHQTRQYEGATRPIWHLRTLAVAAALVVNALILAIGRLVSGKLPAATVGSDDQTIGFGLVIVVTALMGLVAWGLLALLERTTSPATTIWTTIAIVVTVASMYGPFGSGVDTASKLILACLHAGPAVVIIPLMRKSAASS
jgi:hypothetical protein